MASIETRIERETFDEPAVVLERNPLVYWLTIAMMIAGPLALVLAFAKVLSLGVLGFHVFVIGAVLRWSHARSNYSPWRRKRSVVVTTAGVFVNGVLTVAREKIANGFVQPRPSAATVRLLDRRRRILFELEADAARAREVLGVLRLDASSRRADFTAASPVYAFILGHSAVVFGVGAALMASFALVGLWALVPLLASICVVVLAGGVFPARMTIGVDGIEVRWLGWTRFLPLSGLVGVSPVGEHAIALAYVSSKTELLYTSASRSRDVFGREHRDAVLERTRQALDAHRSNPANTALASALSRSARSRDEWLRALATLGKAGGYRENIVRREDLWQVLEDSSAAEDARAGAAMALRTTLDEAGKTRLRAAADAVASPHLRVALEAVAAEGDESVEDAFHEIAKRPAQRSASKP